MEEQEEQTTSRRRYSQGIRIVIFIALFVAVGIGLACNIGIGTLSSMGIGAIAAICPLGILETLLASWTMIPREIIVLVVFVVLTLLLGRWFCGWVCPAGFLSRLCKRNWAGTGRKNLATREEAVLETSSVDDANEAREAREACRNSSADQGVASSSCERPVTTRRVKRVKLDSRHWVLIGALLSSLIFGFPVFCLVCPIGLIFATFIAVWRTFAFAEPTLSLLIFPIIFVLELFVLRKWCSRICPLSALMSLINAAGGNKTFVPHVNTSTCLRVAGKGCTECANVCPEGLDPHLELSTIPMSECTRCRECVENCPVHALTIPFLSKRDTKNMPEISKSDEDSAE